MGVFLFLLIALLLLLLNAFFVLAEFAVVKARPTQVEALADEGNRKAGVMMHIQEHLDAYLSVCQVGITLASIGLGFVGEPAFAKLVEPVIRWAGAGVATQATAHVVAISIAYVIVSFLHIVIGEQVPKMMAIRKTEKAALFTALPLRFFYYLFIVPLWVLNVSVNACLRLMGIPTKQAREIHSEDEVRIILDQSQSGGMMSFRQLLYIENALDMGTLVARNAMRVRKQVRCLSTKATRAETDAIISASRYSRYPLLGDDPEKPLGYIHVKDLFLASRAGKDTDDLKAFVRPCLTAREGDPLEQLLAVMQRRGNHTVLVYGAKGAWTGLITLEDVIEELTGAIEEEFPSEEPIYLSDHLSPVRIVMGVRGGSIIEATRDALSRISAKELPLPLKQILLSVEERERIVNSYVGHNLAIPHARFKDLKKPFVAVARLEEDIPAPTAAGGAIKVLIILLTPMDSPRVHQIFLARIAGMLESEFLEDRLFGSSDPAELYDAIRTAEQTSLD